MDSVHPLVTPPNESSLAQTIGTNGGARSRQSSQTNGHMPDTPTDESTVPHPRPPSNANPMISNRTSRGIQSPLSLAEDERRKMETPRFSVPPQPQDHSTPKTPQPSYSIRDSKELAEHLQYSITTLETHMFLIKDHAKTQLQKLREQDSEREKRLDAAIDILANERVQLEQEKMTLATQLASTRVELKNARDQVRDLKNRHSGDTQGLNHKVKTIGEERTKIQSELSALKVKYNDSRKLISEQKVQIEAMDARLKKSNEANAKLMTSNTQIRLQLERLQQENDELQRQLRQADAQRPESAASSTGRRGTILQRNISVRSSNGSTPAPTTRQARPSSSLRFSNRTQVRDITPPAFSSMIDHDRPDSPKEIGSEIHTASCRFHCHLFEHEGEEGRFRWVCGSNDRVVVVYREQRYVVFVPDVAEIQFFGESPNKGQLIIFWTNDESHKEISVLRVNGVREEYRLDTEGNIIYREVFNFNGPAFRITGDESIQIEPNEETPLLAGVRIVQNSQNDVQIHHQTFGLRIVNSEFLRIQIIPELLQVTMCLCKDRRVFNVKHCHEDFQQKSLCSFVGQCPNMQVR